MVAVILVNYNGADDTIACLHSLMSLSDCGEPVEKIVVDNKSTDESIERLLPLESSLNFVLLKSSENRGFSAANNIGIKYAKKKNAKFFLLLNNDTIVEPDFLNHLKESFLFSKKCGAATSKILYYSDSSKIWYAGGSLSRRTGKTAHLRFNERDKPNEVTPMKVTFASGCCVLLSKELVDTIGLMDEKFFLYEEDVDYSFRIIKSGFDIVYNPKSVIYHKVSSSTGQGSAMSQYYLIRNKFLFLNKSYKGVYRITSFMYCFLQILIRCIKGKFQFKWALCGFYDFVRGVSGRVAREFK